MPDDACQACELMMVLSLLGVGEAYVESLQRLIDSVHALEKRVFSEEVLAKLKPGELTDLYKLSVNETDKRAKYIAGLLATVDGDATRTRLVSYASESGYRPARISGLGDESAARPALFFQLRPWHGPTDGAALKS